MNLEDLVDPTIKLFLPIFDCNVHKSKPEFQYFQVDLVNRSLPAYQVDQPHLLDPVTISLINIWLYSLGDKFIIGQDNNERE